MISTLSQQSEIKEFIQTQLLRRGVSAPITLFKEAIARNGDSHFQLASEPFQTTPVMFKSIKVEEFGSFIWKHDKHEGYHYFSIRIHFRYELFDGGSNGTNFFNVQGELGEGRVWNLVAN
jgi:hypothetical protein